MPSFNFLIFSLLIIFYIIMVAAKNIDKNTFGKKDCGPYCPLDCAPLCTPVCCDISSDSMLLITPTNLMGCDTICKIDMDVVTTLAKDLVGSYECSPLCNQNTTCCNILKSEQLANRNQPSDNIIKNKFNNEISKHYLNTPDISINEPKPSCPFDCLSSCYPACTVACCSLDINAIYEQHHQIISNPTQMTSHIPLAINQDGTHSTALQLYPKKGQCSFDCSPSCFPKCTPACCSKK